VENWPTVLVRPLANLSDNPDDVYLSIGLTEELAHSLCHYREIRVLELPHRNQESDSPYPDVDFIITGNVRRDQERITVAIRLHDARKGFQVWSSKFPGDPEAAKMISFQEHVAAEVAVCVAGGYAAIPRHLAGLSINKAKPDLTTHEAMLRYWESDTLLTPESMVRAIRALEHAVTCEPNYGQIWSMLTAQYADNYGNEIVDLPTPLDKAAEYAQKGVSLDPTNRRARTILGYVRLMENKLQEARLEAETAYNLCPDSLMDLDRIGWLIALAGEWERGIKWVEKAIKLNPYHRPWVRHALILNWLRLGNYEKAYRKTINLTMPDFFWDQIMKACACGHLGRIEEGQACVQTLLALKPDFAQRGRILIGRYIKFENLVDRIIEGLGKLDLRVES
jgi:TolB-like protein/tetratricopeptide (TPR) repeat protein